jgi:uncharacterized protein
MPTQPTDPVDLEPLDQFLLSDRAPEDSMGLSDVDGFLTGIVVGPELIVPSDWMPVIWGSGGDEPAFASVDEAQAILGTIMGRYAEIAAGLDTDPASVEPVFLKGAGSQVIVVTDWAAGFVDAIKLRPAAWEPLLRHPIARRLIVPLLVLGADNPDHPPFGQPPLPTHEVAVLLAGGVRMLPECVVGIHAFWQEHRGQSTPTAQRNRRRPDDRPRRGR